MPDIKEKAEKYKAIFGEYPPWYTSKEDSIKKKLLPAPTQKSLALRSLEEAGKIKKATADSVLAGLKGEKPKSLSQWQEAYKRVYEEGTGTPADSVQLGIKPRATKPEKPEGEKYGSTKWYLSPKWIDTKVGKAFLKKELEGKSLGEQFNYWNRIADKSSNSELVGRAEEEIKKVEKKLLMKLQGAKKKYQWPE